MNEPIEQAVAIAIESYVHAPRTLSVLEVVSRLQPFSPTRITLKLLMAFRNHGGWLQQIARE